MKDATRNYILGIPRVDICYHGSKGIRILVKELGKCTGNWILLKEIDEKRNKRISNEDS